MLGARHLGSKIREALNAMNFAEVEIKRKKLFIKTKGTDLSRKLLRILRIHSPQKCHVTGRIYSVKIRYFPGGHYVQQPVPYLPLRVR